ncbi:hypothetical protein AB6D11_00405 [Vibrio splendidus]
MKERDGRYSHRIRRLCWREGLTLLVVGMFTWLVLGVSQALWPALNERYALIVGLIVGYAVAYAVGLYWHHRGPEAS